MRPCLICLLLLLAAPPVPAASDSTAVPPLAPAPSFGLDVDMFMCLYNDRLAEVSPHAVDPHCGSAIVLNERGEPTGAAGLCRSPTNTCYCPPNRMRVFIAQGGYWEGYEWGTQSRTFVCLPI